MTLRNAQCSRGRQLSRATEMVEGRLLTTTRRLGLTANGLSRFLPGDTRMKRRPLRQRGVLPIFEGLVSFSSTFLRSLPCSISRGYPIMHFTRIRCNAGIHVGRQQTSLEIFIAATVTTTQKRRHALSVMKTPNPRARHKASLRQVSNRARQLLTSSCSTIGSNLVWSPILDAHSIIEFGFSSLLGDGKRCATLT